MTPPLPDTQVYVRLLADRQGKPGALQWRAATERPADLLPWFAQDCVAALARQVPCLWDATSVAPWPADVRQALVAAGMVVTESSAVAESDTGFLAPAGKDWLAGRWYLQPPAKPSSAQSASRTQAMRLLQLVASDAETHEIEEVFRHDATLSYQLLRLVNSAGTGSGRVVTSFAQAILMLGRQQLRRWVNLLLFAARDDDPRSAMLMAHVTLRARGMELLAHEAGLDRAQQDQAFMAGMFSMLGVLFGQPLAQVLPPLNLTTELRQALLEDAGDLGLLLRTWQASEQADGPALAALLGQLGLDINDHNRVLPQACSWMLSLTGGDKDNGGSR